MLSRVRGADAQVKLFGEAKGLNRHEVEKKIADTKGSRGKAKRAKPLKHTNLYEATCDGLPRLAAALRAQAERILAAFNPKLPLSDAARVAQALDGLKGAA